MALCIQGLKMLREIGLLVLFITLASLSTCLSEMQYSVDYNVVVENNLSGTSIINVNMTTRFTYELKLSVMLSKYGGLSICYHVIGINASLVNGTISKCIAMSLNDFLNKMFNGWVFPAPGLGLKIQGSFLHGKTEFLGYSSYSGLPVYKFRVIIPLSFPGLTSRTSLVNATLYCYAGFGLPIHVSAKSELLTTTSIKAELQSTDLPDNPPTSYTVTGNYVVIIGGMPGAELIAMGSKGNETLHVMNKGNNIGYIIVIRRETGSVIVEQVDPGKTLSMKLPAPLDQEVSIEARNTSHTSQTYYYVLVCLGIAAAAVIAYITLRKKSGKAT